VSHDLRTPLTAMGLDIESLSARLSGDDAGAGSLRSLAAEHERLARRVDNLLSSARLEAGLARPRPEPVEPADLFRAARENLTRVLAGREVRVRVDPECPAVWLDPSLGLEMIVNLLENAARAAPRHMPLELAAAAAGADRVALEVADRGPGLPPALRHLLETHADLRPAAGAAADSGAGGLGLLIARGFAEAQGGTLALLQRPGGGTVARLELPAAAGPPADGAEA
jgi:two-component system sensor histidine kinase KdpD